MALTTQRIIQILVTRDGDGFVFMGAVHTDMDVPGNCFWSSGEIVTEDYMFGIDFKVLLRALLF